MKILLLAFLFLAACSSHPVLPSTKDIKLSRDPAPERCEYLGAVTGRSPKVKPSVEEVLEDVKAEAVRMGANYVKIESMGAMSASIRGLAYFCK